MDLCIEKLQALAKHQPQMAQAVENLCSDLHSPTNLHGNIPAPLAEALERACSGCAPENAQHLIATVQAHRTVQRPELRSPTQIPEIPFLQTHFLRICFSKTTIAAYHLSRGNSDPHAGAESAAAAHDWIATLTPNTPPKSFDITQMQGTTGRIGAATWWTFAMGGVSTPVDAATYLNELALAAAEINRAASDGMAVEVAIPAAAFAQEFYKPAAVDSFIENTLFRPDLGAEPFGWTAPQELGLQRRPEVISKALYYEEIGTPNTRITLTVLPFKKPTP